MDDVSRLNLIDQQCKIASRAIQQAEQTTLPLDQNRLLKQAELAIGAIEELSESEPIALDALKRWCTLSS
jgi:hypothetical protein